MRLAGDVAEKAERRGVFIILQLETI